jgi:hypothetical protein
VDARSSTATAVARRALGARLENGEDAAVEARLAIQDRSVAAPTMPNSTSATSSSVSDAPRLSCPRPGRLPNARTAGARCGPLARAAPTRELPAWRRPQRIESHGMRTSGRSPVPGLLPGAHRGAGWIAASPGRDRPELPFRGGARFTRLNGDERSAGCESENPDREDENGQPGLRAG